MENETSYSFIGAGRLAAALARALARHGCAVSMVASRRNESATRLAAALPGCRAVAMAEAAGADVVFLTVPDDDIAGVAAALPWRAGQAVVHCSGATEVAALAPAAAAGAQTGGFHPLQVFAADPALAESRLPGSYVAVEGPDALAARLEDIALRLQMHPLRLPAGARVRYHCAASYAASFLLSMLQEAAAIWGSFGIAEDDALAALLPLARGTLDAAEKNGLPGAVAGPLSRGDRGVVERHLAAMHALGPDHAALYREFARRQLALIARSDRLPEARIAALQTLVKSDATDALEAGGTPSGR